MFLKSATTIFIICGVFAISVAKSVATDEQKCTEACALIYAPVCATNGKEYKIFNNNCDFEANNCRLERDAAEKYVLADKDWCNTELVHDEPNLMVKLRVSYLDTPQCMRPCPLIIRPVCASNGRYRIGFINDCLMEGINCLVANKTEARFNVLRHGTC